MAHRMYLLNVGEVDDSDAPYLQMMEWNYHFPTIASPLLCGAPFLDLNHCNDTGEKEGIYACAEEGKALITALYALLERHADRLIDDLEAFREAKRKVLAFLTHRAVHRYFHLIGWDVFNLSEQDHPAQASALLERIQRDNVRIRMAIEADDPALLDQCEGIAHEEAGSFRELINQPHYDFGWEPLTSSIYTQAEAFEEGGLMGLMSVTGEVLIPPCYDEIGEFDWWELAIVRQGDRFGYIHADGRRITPVKFEQALPYQSGDYARVAEEGLWGLVDGNGTQVVPCIHAELRELRYAAAHVWAARAHELWGVIDATGQWLLPPDCAQIDDGTGTIFATRPGSLVPQAYTNRLVPLGAFASDQLMQFKLKVKPCDDGNAELEHGAVFHYVRRVPDSDGHQALVDATGVVLLKLAPGDDLEFISDEGLYVVRRGSKCGLFRATDRQWVLPLEYQRIQQVHQLISHEERHAGWMPLLVEKDGQWGLFQASPASAWLIQPACAELKHFRAKWLSFRQGDAWGIVDHQGGIRCAPRYDSLLATEPDGMWVATGFRNSRVFAIQADGTEELVPAVAAQAILELYIWLGLLDDGQRRALEDATQSKAP